MDALALGSLVLLSNDIARTSQALHPDRLPFLMCGFALLPKSQRLV